MLESIAKLATPSHYTHRIASLHVEPLLHSQQQWVNRFYTTVVFHLHSYFGFIKPEFNVHSVASIVLLSMPNIRRKMSSNPPSDSSSNESHDATPLEVEVVAQRQPLSRRGHFKSRLGCFNCKRRRVKCNELRPHCSPCHRLELTCTYPTLIAASTGPRPAPSALVLEDLRFYHHFVTGAFPSLPLMADKAWVQAASMSSNVRSHFVDLCPQKPLLVFIKFIATSLPLPGF